MDKGYAFAVSNFALTIVKVNPMIKDIKNVVTSTSSAIASTAMIVDELAKAGLDQAKALRVRNVIELQQEFAELGYDSAKTKQAIDEMNDIFSALS